MVSVAEEVGLSSSENPLFESLVAPADEGGGALYFAYWKRRLVLSGGQVPSEMAGLTVASRHYLGRLGDLHVHALELAEPPAAADATLHDLREVLGRLAAAHASLAGRAVQILEWDRTHRFCGACGTPTQPSTTTRSRVCPACQLAQFPRVSPAIIVAIERGDEILLARGPHFPPGIHSVLAGFVDPGESVEDAVAREVLEEVGLHIRNLRYFGSQPWPFPNSLMLGFQAEYAGGDITPDPGEIESAAFYRFDRMPSMFPGRISIAQWLVADFLKRHGVAS